jgi:hypothetical protein
MNNKNFEQQMQELLDMQAITEVLSAIAAPIYGPRHIAGRANHR